MPALLLILDGWGYAGPGPGNAVAQARTPNLDRFWTDYPRTLLTCSGEVVGLPPGQMGNSEVGHLNIGAGRTVYQDILRIDKAIEDGTFFENRTLLDLLETIKSRDKTLHLMGLVSDGGVHSHLNHLYALLKAAKENRVRETVVHVILDGRDTAPTSGKGYVRQLQSFLKTIDYGRIGSVSGRYYAMDRDKRWERTARAYRSIVLGKGPFEQDAVTAVEKAYAAAETDEFVQPMVINREQGPAPGIADGDGVFFFNFRADRARQLVRSLFEEDFQEFDRERPPDLSGLVTMTEYDSTFGLKVAFPQLRLEKILGQICAEEGLKQLRIAETEKYAHVTYFFNGGREEPFPGEERILIPSPQEVATYDLKPEMSAYEVTDALRDKLGSREFDFVVCNLANLDMVGHSGNFQATVAACEAVDACCGRIVEAVLASGGRCLLTADHGNAETMLDSSGNPQTAHSKNQVPLIWIESRQKGQKLREFGILADIAPTLLDLWGLARPEEMTGRSLLT
ncbi:MAG: 2,3-bisphosphoglycerate-independent phosphoglycerate mutase [Desulfohalobiaceae bacterium]|nr:2,3-bisphosphoglycerate-independent phosphoglycerate mutase [Desulfohalobiaceae bacterium]